MGIHHFLTLLDFAPQELQSLIQLAIYGKNNPGPVDHCRNKNMAMIFEKSSTRTRLSFEVGMKQLGGDAIFLSNKDTQSGRGEPIPDSARVISSMVDIIMLRTFDHATLELFAQYSTVPVINALTDSYHPCQLLADMLTYFEQRGSISGKTVSWIGDGNNMCQSYINAAKQFDFQLNIACPVGYEPDANLLEANKDRIMLTQDPVIATRGSHLVVTDVFTSMGQEQESQQRLNDFDGFMVDHELLSYADSNVAFMHCLPAHRGEEVSNEVMEDESISLVWCEAENRLHAQKALIQMLL